MKYHGQITDPKDLVTKEYVDNAAPTPATQQQIEGRTAPNPIAPSNLEYAVNSCLASTEQTLSAIQKQHAHEYLGTIPLLFTLSNGTVLNVGFVAHEITPSND